MTPCSKVNVMPSLKKHCKRTMKRYGVEGRDIHEWLDEPSKKYAGTHRQFRHDTETIRLVGEIFGKKYGRSLAENIALDHIMLDHEEEIKKRRTIVVKFPEKKEIPSVPCTFCNTLLKPSDQFCPKCGASRKKIIEEFDRAYEMEKIKLQEKKKKLRKELKHELSLRELSPEDRIHWLVFLTPRDPVLQRLVQEDFEKNPQLREVFENLKVGRQKAEKRVSSEVNLLLLGLWAFLVVPAIYFTIVYGVYDFGIFWCMIWTVIFLVLAMRK